MKYSDKIILANEDDRAAIEEFEAGIDELTLGEKLFAAQSLNEQSSELSFAKVLVLYLYGEKEVQTEVRRVIIWQYRAEKSVFLVSQTHSEDNTLVLNSIHLIGILKEPKVLPSLSAIFDLANIELCKAITSTMSMIGDPFAAKTLKKALTTSDNDLLLLIIRSLSQWTDDVSWKVFRKLLKRPDENVKIEAAFAISLRKNRKSAGFMMKAIDREKDDNIRCALMKHIGLIPSESLIIPLLKVITSDESQKARLVASRTLDRLQGILPQRAFFKLRRIRSVLMRAEVIFRLGKFGTDKNSCKNFLRRTIKKSKDVMILQSAIQAVGFIAEHSDAPLLLRYLNKDPLTSYIAVVALTRLWRLEDKEDVLKLLNEPLTPIQKQVILKYMMRRRGLGIRSEDLLPAVRKLYATEENISVRYLALTLLAYAPTTATVEFLLSTYIKTDNTFEKEGIHDILPYIIHHQQGAILDHIAESNAEQTILLLKFVPQNEEPAFYDKLAKVVFKKYPSPQRTERFDEISIELYDIFFTRSKIARHFLSSLPDAEWQKIFVGLILSKAPLDMIKDTQKELMHMLSVKDDELRMSIMQLLIPLKDPASLPNLVEVAETDPDNKTGVIAKNIIKGFIEEGII